MFIVQISVQKLFRSRQYFQQGRLYFHQLHLNALDTQYSILTGICVIQIDQSRSLKSLIHMEFKFDRCLRDIDRQTICRNLCFNRVNQENDRQFHLSFSCLIYRDSPRALSQILENQDKCMSAPCARRCRHSEV